METGPETTSSSNHGNGSTSSFSSSFSAPVVPQLSSDKASVSTRSKPRLVKQRKQASSRSGRSAAKSASAPGPTDSGFNPFRSVSERCKSNSFNSSNGDIKLETSDNVGFCFDAFRGDLNFLEKTESGDITEKSGTDDKEKVILESGVDFAEGKTELEQGIKLEKTSNMGFAFWTRLIDSKSNLDLRKSLPNGSMEEVVYAENRDSGEVEKSIYDDRGKIKIQNEDKCEKFSISLDLNSARGKLTESFRNSFSSGNEKLKQSEIESQNAKATSVSSNPIWDRSSKLEANKGVSMSGVTGKKSSTWDKGMVKEAADEIKLNSVNGVANYRIDNDRISGLDVDNKCVNILGIDNKMPTCSGRNHVLKLPEDMEKLNISDNGKVDAAVKIKDSNLNLCTDGNTGFVCGSADEKASGSSTISSAPASAKNSNNGDAADKTDKINLKTACEKSFETWIASSGLGAENTMPNENTISNVRGRVGEANEQNNLGHFCQVQTDNNIKLNEAATISSFSTINKAGKNEEYGAASMQDGFKPPLVDFSMPNWDSSYSFKANLFLGINKKPDSTVKSCKSVKNSKKARGKMKQFKQVKHQSEQRFMSKNNFQENLDSPGCYSPMDFSPYQETPSNESLNDYSVPSASYSTISTDARDENLESRESVSECPGFSEKPSGAENVRLVFEATSSKSDGFSSNTERQESESRMPFSFGSRLNNIGKENFVFAASSSGQGCLSATKHRTRKKNRTKVSYATAPCSKVEHPSPYVQVSHFDSTSSGLKMDQDQKHDSYSSQSKGENESHADEEQIDHGTMSPSVSVEEICDKWRSRGNQAYKDGDLTNAEVCYTRGISSMRRGNKLGRSIEPLVLCYSNRAATRMSLGRIREALGDCMMAAALDPSFLKVQLRAANCHLLLGEVEDAMQYFQKCLELQNDVVLDRRVIIEASEGVKRAQKIAECRNRSAELLQQRTSDAAVNALEVISEGLKISIYSEKLLEMKGEALCMLHRYEEVIQLCEHTLDFAEKNFASDDHLPKVDGAGYMSNSSVRLWRWQLISESHFHLGRLEMALDTLEKHKQSSIPLAVAIRELLRLKNAGNEAFQLGWHREAVEHYTAALSTNFQSRPFLAICFCNRAAAFQALGQIIDAIADCSLAMALNNSYQKAISRRATLFEMIRDYGEAASNLKRLISVLEKKTDNEGAKRSGSVKDLRQARQRLSLMEEESKKGIPSDLYLILGIKQSDTAAEIRKAYRKAALRHHPDKAGQFLARSESGADGRLWKEIAEEVHKDADRLFKMIGEAYAVLSDPTKRSQYDIEEERRNTQKSVGSSVSGRNSNFQSHPFERNYSRQYWWETCESRTQW